VKGLEAQAGDVQPSQAEGADEQSSHQIGGDCGQVHKFCQSGQHQTADEGGCHADQIDFHDKMPSLNIRIAAKQQTK